MMANAPTIQEASTVEETAARMKARLAGIVPEVEITLKAELAFEINKLKREMNAVILGHNYMEPALYVSVPDYVGDSLQLARVSAETDADIIVFCGVQFMAETAKVLNPGKEVLIPAEKAGCSLAEGITPDDIRMLRDRFPGSTVVSYVNTNADVKAVSDYCCTSGNSSAVVRHILDSGQSKILFLPDEFLAKNTAAEMGLPFVEGWNPEGADEAAKLDTAIIGWKARCEVHDLFTVDDVESIRKQFPGALIIAHPECSPEVIERVDISGSTKKMVDLVQESDAKMFALLTECSMGDNLATENPDKEMLRLCSHRCPYMALITLEDTLESLEKRQYPVELPDEVIRAARQPIDRMLQIF